MAIINALPNTLTNGTTADASQVMADLNQIVNNVNSNAAENGANTSITSLGGLLTPLSIAQGGTGSGTALGARTNLGIIPDVGLQEFRLTLTTGVPVTTADVTAATTIYCCPYVGNRIALYDGVNWNIRTSAQFSLALGTLTAGIPYDVFCYDNAGVPTLELTAWTNGSTRVTALVYQDGVLVKSGAATRRYLGSFVTTATTTTEDSATNRYLYNYYHRVKKVMRRVESVANWTYTVATWRQANANAANQLNFLIGVLEDSVNATISSRASNTNAGVFVQSGIGLNSTSTPIDPGTLTYTVPTASGFVALVSSIKVYPITGVNFLSWLEWSQALGTTTWEGSSIFGIMGEVML